MTGLEQLKRRIDRLERQGAGPSVLIIEERNGRMFHRGTEISAEEYEKLRSEAQVLIKDNIGGLRK